MTNDDLIDDGLTTDDLIISGQSEDDNDGWWWWLWYTIINNHQIWFVNWKFGLWIRLTREQNKQNAITIIIKNNLQVNENKQESENMHYAQKKSVWSVFSVFMAENNEWMKTWIIKVLNDDNKRSLQVSHIIS